MIYITERKEAFYYIAEPVGEVFFDLYNFSSMSRTEEALQTIINWNIELLRLKGIRVNVEYTLVLDFLTITETSHTSSVTDRLVKYFSDKGFNSNYNNKIPLKLTIKNLKIEDVLSIIQDNTFQSLNNTVSSLNCSTWRLIIQN